MTSSGSDRCPCEGTRGISEWVFDRLRPEPILYVLLKPCPVHGSPPYSGRWDGRVGPVVAVLAS